MDIQGCGSRGRNPTCDPAYHLIYLTTPTSRSGEQQLLAQNYSLSPSGGLFSQKWGGLERRKPQHTHVTVTRKHPSTHHNDLFAFCVECGEPCLLLSFKLELWFPMLTIMLHYYKHLYIVNLNNTHTLCHSSEWKTITKEAKVEPLWKP